MPLNLGDLRTDSLSVAQLPKLDVAGSSPVARSGSVVRELLAKMACRFRQAIFAPVTRRTTPVNHWRRTYVVTCGSVRYQEEYR